MDGAGVMDDIQYIGDGKFVVTEAIIYDWMNNASKAD